MSALCTHSVGGSVIGHVGDGSGGDVDGAAVMLGMVAVVMVLRGGVDGGC